MKKLSTFEINIFIFSGYMPMDKAGLFFYDCVHYFSPLDACGSFKSSLWDALVVAGVI